MSYTTKEEYDVLHGLKVRGMAAAEPLAVSTGLPPTAIQHILNDAVARGLARSRTGGRVEGYMMTAEGRQRHATLRAREVRPEQIAALQPAYEAFLRPNREFKILTTQWQTEADGDMSQVLPGLLALHDELGAVLSIASSALPRMKLYLPRFDRALAAFRAGDPTALTKPMSDSYHDVWMELHEDLLVTLGRDRTDDDE